MASSEAWIAADRREGGLSLDPEPTERRKPSRAEALHRGLRDSPAVPESFELVRDRSADWYRALKPRNDFHAWLVDQIAVISIRVDRSERIERRLRDRHSLRAEVAWEADRRREAEALGARLGKRPGEVAEALRRTPQGCDWLIARWALLAHAADLQGSWTPEQAAMAFDLLGTPAEFREGREPWVKLDSQGRLVGPPEGPAAVARRESAALGELRETVAGLDEVDRSLAEADLSDESNHELKKLRRHESALHRRLRWCFAQLKYESPHPGPAPGIHPRWVERPEAEAPAGPASAPATATTTTTPDPEVRTRIDPHPPFDLDPEEDPGPGKVADIPAILSARRARQERKVEARRDARRRKLEHLRA